MDATERARLRPMEPRVCAACSGRGYTRDNGRETWCPWCDGNKVVMRPEGEVCR